MSSTCSFMMKIRGTMESCAKFANIITGKDTMDGRHFWRVSAGVCDSFFNDQDEFVCIIDGECAWSVSHCMTAGVGAYYYRNPKESLTLSDISKELGLVIEAYSDDFCSFMEHIAYCDGEELEYWSKDVAHFYYDDSEFGSFEEFQDEYGLYNYSESDLDENDEIVIGALDKVFIYA